MYACVFFEEDSSLSVIWKEDRDLSLIEDFKEHHKVEMKWLLRPGTPKTLYHGIIVKVSEDKAYLDTFANKAYTAIIKDKLPVQGDNQGPPEELFTFDLGDNVKGKRKRTKTDRVVQSEQQDEELSPKKKKKDKAEKEKLNEELSPKKKKKDKVEKEKKDKDQTKKKTVEKTTKKKSETATLQQVGQLIMKEAGSDLMNQFSVDDSNSNGEAENAPIPLPDLPTALPSDVLDKNNEDDQHDKPNIILPVHVDLTSTWKVCTNAMDAVHDEIPAHDATVTNTCVIPVPSAEVLTVIKGLLRNDVQDYLKAVIAWSARQHPCSERKEYINLSGTCTVDDRQNNLETMNEENLPSATNFLDDSFNYTSALNESDINPLVRRSPRKPNRPTEGERQNIYPIETASCSYESQPSKSAVAETLRRSPRKNNLTETQKKSSERQQVDISDSHQSIAPETVPPRSENVIKDGKMVKLLESHDILVDKDLLRNAISAAKKSQKVGYTLCYKLLSGMFSIPELANSRGQGIGKRKEGDIRPPLKKETVNTLKDYVIVWCKKNGYTTPTEQLLNDAITERISYARKQLKTSSKKL